MRILWVVAIVAGCLAASHLLSPAALSGLGVHVRGAPIAQKEIRAKPGRIGNDTCRWARDNECDEPDIGTGACTMGTDFSDCRALRQGENDSCQYAHDHECDEPNFGTGACTQGTDHSDCGDIAWMRNTNDSCATAFNGVCEEPGHANGRCPARTDRTDCHGRARPMTISDHFFGRDDRQRVDATQFPWRAIGQLHLDSGEGCTATLIGRDTLVTAAHCIVSEHGVNASGRWTTAPGAPGGAQQARVIAYLIDRNFDYRRFNETDDIDGLDWALLRIDQPLGERLGFAGVRVLTNQPRPQVLAADLYQAGYAWDTGEFLTGHLRCHIVDARADNTFIHECDTTKGDSGSSFLVRNGERYDVIGVDSSFRENPTHGPFLYAAVSAAAFARYVDDFNAHRIGLPVGAASGKPSKH